MPVIPGDDNGLHVINGALGSGTPVVLPMPSPLPYTVAGRNPAAVNAVKGRPGAQPLGMVVADMNLVAAYVDLDSPTLAFAEWLSAHQLLNLFLPVRPDAPDWTTPSTMDGLLGVTLACSDAVRGLLDRWGHLYLSSANRTGEDVAVAATAAEATFSGQLCVLDGDASRDPTVPSGSATIVRVRPDSQIEVVRHGINDADRAGTSERFCADLAHRFASRDQPS